MSVEENEDEEEGTGSTFKRNRVCCVEGENCFKKENIEWKIEDFS